ncbi:MAG: OmpA family protein [Acidobacteria bacterium]|nr:OmpA family protein [Acidobacteriota bacterium]
MIKSKTAVMMLFAMFLFTVSGFSADRNLYENNQWVGHRDVAGSRDYPLVSRFSGSIIQYCKTLKWDKYTLPVSPIVPDGGGKTWKKKLNLAGKITRLQYTVSRDNNSAYVYANYLTALKNAGWKILFTGNGDRQLGNDSREWCNYYYGNDGLNLGRYGNSFNPEGDNHCYIAAEYQDEGRTVYAAIYITDYENSPKGLAFTLITQDTIEIQAPKTGLVTAKVMTDKIRSRGHVSLDGVYFESGKATLKRSSSAQLKTIAEFLKAHGKRKYYIVGHTDNIGTYERNMALSLNRAKAVKNVLVQRFGIPVTQLKACGVGPVAPVLSNETEDGRARNRRVEIAEQ